MPKNFYYTLLPIVFIQFWYIESPLAMIAYFGSLNRAFLQLFSLTLLIQTFFQPLKNEYRKGLVGFSIGMGIGVKSILIMVDVFLFAIVLAVEFLVLATFVLFPAVALFLLFK